uniref:NADH-ubiquinone oxidoreductase chain 3 n=1 Tax=Pseudococculinidae sp. MNHN-IM-2013-40847 TaxID=2496598 RepID=A0A6B7FP84_9VEST|nr:NADH dehydrogenase subunit 3 [Pseudococculinidae sp. MNHN-IM-2013-40847]
MLSVISSSLIVVILAMVIILLAWILTKRMFTDREKDSPFECGFDPLGSARLPFSLRFFLLAVIFLVFDVEIVLLFPAICKSLNSFSASTYLSILLFILILIIGLFHEWNEGSLDWMK